jgi:hypothetical protein
MPDKWMKRGGWLLALICVATFSTSCDTLEKVGKFVDSISDGAPCERDGACLGGRCLTPEQGFPKGYCTTLECDVEGCSGLNSECFRTQLEGKEIAACYELCDFDGSCERAEEGYTCVQLQGSAVCLPPDVTAAPPQGVVGAGCSSELQCNGEDAVCLTNWRGGYCSELDCSNDEDCLGDSVCAELDGENVEAQTACLAPCEAAADCRNGYVCETVAGKSVCVEGDASGPVNPDGADDGESCVSNINCKGGNCIREREGAGGDVAYPGGYCSTRDCDADDECFGDAVCISRERTTTCMASCSSSDECRDGYKCQTRTDGTGFCDSSVEPVAPADDDGPFDIVCGSQNTLDFSVPDGSEGFFIAPFTRENVQVFPKRLNEPGGGSLDIQRDYAFHAVNPEVLGSLAPILFPASDRSAFRNRFGGGDYSLTVQTEASEICYYVIPVSEAGTQLDINLYFVGVPGVDASSAPSDPNIARTIDVVEQIYGDMGVDVSVQNYYDASEDVTTRYSIIRDFYDVFDLVATSRNPGPTADERLSVNVFLIRGFNVSEAPGLLGVSAGIPGVAGMHGNSGAGLVFSTSNLGQDNETLGQTMAHEIGHFVGLRHTTEHRGLGHDPITDTPECLIPDLGFLCPDSKNFMFAYSIGSGQFETTPGQAFVVRRSPLVK